MKKIISLLTMVLLVVHSFGQATTAPAMSKQDYLQKSKNQKTTGWVLLGAGTAMAVGGAIMFGKSDFLSGNDSNTDAGGFLFVGGVVADLASIPFFISSAKNARKAAAISINQQKILLPLANGLVVKTLPSITVRLVL